MITDVGGQQYSDNYKNYVLVSVGKLFSCFEHATSTTPPWSAQMQVIAVSLVAVSLVESGSERVELCSCLKGKVQV